MGLYLGRAGLGRGRGVRLVPSVDAHPEEALHFQAGRPVQIVHERDRVKKVLSGRYLRLIDLGNAAREIDMIRLDKVRIPGIAYIAVQCQIEGLCNHQQLQQFHQSAFVG